MSVKHENLLVPAELYDEALAFCNARRAEKNLEPITALPAGLSPYQNKCPCANSVGDLWVGERMYWREFGPRRPHGIDHFIAFFDENAMFGVLTLPVRDASLTEESRND